MDFALSSSMVLGAAVLLWLLWVAPYLLKRRRPPRAAAEAALLSEAAAGAPQDEARAGAGSSPGLDHAVRSAGSERAGKPEDDDAGTRAAPGAGSRPAPRPFRIRWGRVVIAGIGVAMLLASVVCLALVVLGVPLWVPLVFAAGTAASATVLRSLAVRDQRRRVDAAFRAAMRDPGPAPAQRQRPLAPSEVFDAGNTPAPAPKVLTREELRAVALEVARASQASAAAAAKASGADSEETWEPVGVPKPSYLDAAKAERPEPEPLPAQEDPKPEGRPALKPRPETPEPGSVPGVPALAPRPTGRAGALGNLDDVLRRRRA
ncbi:hypothetical protein [Sinomonas atrocyanea]|uniref:hypothetical protein n=1 Tax=Sinomonas atrocyanea TaxID=37927 RepID=UPI003D96954E